MYKLSIVFTATASLLLTFFGIGYGIDLDTAKERPCFEVTKTVEVDPNWHGYNSKTWYYPLMSRLDLYYTGLEVSGKEAKELQENELYYDGCLHFEMPNDTVEIIGFGGRRSPMNVTSSNDTDIKTCHFVNQSGLTGTVYTTLTDNATFIFAVACVNESQMTWGVSSIKKTLPKETVKLIHDHAESLGFKREFFTGIRYDYCDLV